LWIEVEINILLIITFKNKGSIVIFIKLERQSDAIKNIQKNVDNTFKNVDNTSKYQDLKQDVLKSQGNVITRWLSVIGIVLIILTTFAGYEVIVIQDNIDSSKELLKKSKSTLIEIQTHEKNAKKLVRKTESSARQVEKQIPRNDFFVSANGFLILF
jgi:hypothetical protein